MICRENGGTMLRWYPGGVPIVDRLYEKVVMRLKPRKGKSGGESLVQLQTPPEFGRDQNSEDHKGEQRSQNRYGGLQKPYVYPGVKGDHANPACRR